MKDRPVKFELRTIDVLHNFYVPQFRGKMDMVPGIVTYYWLTPTRVGDFEVSEQHSLVIVNRDRGRAKDLLELAERLRTEVYRRFGVTLEIEPEFLPVN